MSYFIMKVSKFVRMRFMLTEETCRIKEWAGLLYGQWTVVSVSQCVEPVAVDVFFFYLFVVYLSSLTYHRPLLTNL